MLVIGLGHKAGHGKDELGTYLRQKYGFTVYHYADALKRECAACGWSPANKNVSASEVLTYLLEYSARLETDLSRDLMAYITQPENQSVLPIEMQKSNRISEPGPRVSFLQWYGTAYRRRQDTDYWVRQLVTQITHEMPEKAVVCDMRFHNEYWAIQRFRHYTVANRLGLGGLGFTVDVRRIYDSAHPLAGQEHRCSMRDSDHISETMLDGCPHDFYFRASSLSQLHQQADNMLLYIQEVVTPTFNYLPSHITHS